MAVFFFEDLSVLFKGPFRPRQSQTFTENLNALSCILVTGFCLAHFLGRPGLATLVCSLCAIAAMYYNKMDVDNHRTFTPVHLTRLPVRAAFSHASRERPGTYPALAVAGKPPDPMRDRFLWGRRAPDGEAPKEIAPRTACAVYSLEKTAKLVHPVVKRRPR